MLIIRKEAEEDIKSAYQWYEAKQNGLGTDFLVDVSSKLEKIEEYPYLYQKVMGNIRRVLCQRFPYSIYFIQKDIDIVIIAVLHQRRNPAVLQAR